MIRPSGVIFTPERTLKNSKTQSKKYDAVEHLDGDSGVGQAPESSSKSSTNSAFSHQPSAFRQKKTAKILSASPLNSGKFFYTSRLFSKLGTALIIFSILGFLFTYGPIIQVELGYRLSKAVEEKNQPQGGFAKLLDQTLLGEQEGVPDPAFSLLIPKIHAKAKVIPDVDPGNEAEYLNALKQGVAHAKGTQYPGGDGTIYMFAHSTDSPINIVRYNAVFYLLKELEVGDEIDVYYQGSRHRYNVFDKKIVEPNDVSYLSPTNTDHKELLILQTCWPPGTTLKRLLIFAKK